MAKKKTNSKKQTMNAFKVSEGRAKKAKKNKSNINFKKLKTKTNEEVEQLNKTLNDLQRDVRTGKHKNTFKSNPRINGNKPTNVNIDETINKLSNL